MRSDGHTLPWPPYNICFLKAYSFRLGVITPNEGCLVFTVGFGSAVALFRQKAPKNDIIFFLKAGVLDSKDSTHIVISHATISVKQEIRKETYL